MLRSHGARWLEGLAQDARLAARTLRQNPGFAVTAIATLAIGIGINAAVFTVTNATLFKGFPLVERNDRLVYITEGRGCCVSYPNFEDWRSQATTLDGMAIVHGMAATLADDTGFPERYDLTEVSAGTFALTGQRPFLGRDFTLEDEAPGASPVAILRHGLWARRFGSDPAVIGRTVRVNGIPTTIVGVMPPGFSFPQNQDIWVPLVPTADVRRRDNRNTWFVLGRMMDDATVESVRTEMATIGRRLALAYPDVNANQAPIVSTFDEFFIGANASTVYRALWGAVGFVLLIACANVANLFLARTTGRTREFSVRVALGAGRWRIARQVMVESLMLSGLGGLAGWALAAWSVRIYASFATGAAISDATPGNWFDHVLDYAIDGQVVAYLAVISAGAGVLFGLAPALRLTTLDIHGVLKDGGRGAAGGRAAQRASRFLVAAEMALAVMLLTGAGVLLRSVLNVERASLGVETKNLVAALVSLPDTRYPDEAARARFYDTVNRQLEGAAGIEAVAVMSELPGWRARPWPFELASGSPANAAQRPTASTLVVGPSYFETVGARLLSGRAFGGADTSPSQPVAIVNERFAREHWPTGDALGERVRLYNGQVPGPWLTVVGVAPNIVQSDPTRQTVEPIVYVPFAQRSQNAMWVVARASVTPSTVVGVIRREVQVMDRELSIAIGPLPLDERLAPSNQYRGFTAGILMFFAAVALVLAAVGLYAVVTHAVSQRTREIGTHMAMGASARDIRWWVLRYGMSPLLTGLVVGLAASVAVGRVLSGQLVGVSAADPLTSATVAVVLVAVAWLACDAPARRAMRVDPVVALAQE